MRTTTLQAFDLCIGRIRRRAEYVPAKAGSQNVSNRTEPSQNSKITVEAAGQGPCSFFLREPAQRKLQMQVHVPQCCSTARRQRNKNSSVNGERETSPHLPAAVWIASPALPKFRPHLIFGA